MTCRRSFDRRSLLYSVFRSVVRIDGSSFVFHPILLVYHSTSLPPFTHFWAAEYRRDRIRASGYTELHCMMSIFHRFTLFHKLLSIHSRKSSVDLFIVCFQICIDFQRFRYKYKIANISTTRIDKSYKSDTT